MLEFVFLDDRFQRGRLSKLLQGFPVEVGRREEDMVFELVPSIHAQSVLRLELQKIVDETLQLWGRLGVFPCPFLLGHLNKSLDFQAISYISSGKRRTIVGHFVSVDSQGPEVGRPIIPILQNHLRSLIYLGAHLSFTDV